MDRDAITVQVEARLRVLDFCGWMSNVVLAGVLPELDEAQASTVLSELLAAVRTVAPNARVGLAVYPSSAVEPDALLAAARSAARTGDRQRPATAAAAAEGEGAAADGRAQGGRGRPGHARA